MDGVGRQRQLIEREKERWEMRRKRRRGIPGSSHPATQQAMNVLFEDKIRRKGHQGRDSTDRTHLIFTLTCQRKKDHGPSLGLLQVTVVKDRAKI